MLCKIAAHFLAGVQQQDPIRFYLLWSFDISNLWVRVVGNGIIISESSTLNNLHVSRIPYSFKMLNRNSLYVVRQERKARQWVESRFSLSSDWQLAAWRAVISLQCAVAQTQSTVPFCSCSTLDTRRQRTTLNSCNSTVSVYFVCVLCCVNLLYQDLPSVFGLTWFFLLLHKRKYNVCNIHSV